ncbi:MAG: hypothetical protein FWH04_05680 [Oscillospiraceae bacterium]|nr:hypothetical protein [Oscillospiraceae bacterium]
MKIKTLLLIFMFFLSACESSQPQNLESFTESTNEEIGCVELIHNGNTYRPFGVLPDRKLRDIQIGLRNNDASLPIYSVKGYNSADWIIEVETGFMSGNDLLYRNISVQQVPDEFEEHRDYSFDAPKQTDRNE